MVALHREIRIAVGLVLACACVSVAPLVWAAEPFVSHCTTPSFPGKAVAVDSRCGIDGTPGGHEVEQNRLKNNFCAGGTPEIVSFSHLRDLQVKVEKNSQINFGDRANPGARGPTTDRAPLMELGEGKLVQIRGFVLLAKQEGDESVNCGKDFDDEEHKNLFHDIHIALVETSALAGADPNDKASHEAAECKGIVVEMSPHHRPPEWTAGHINQVAHARLPIRVTGHLFFDSSHVPCDGDQEVRTNPRRMSLWEIHPIYKFEVCTAGCSGAGTWLPLEEWKPK